MQRTHSDSYPYFWALFIWQIKMLINGKIMEQAVNFNSSSSVLQTT
jgi:hypothetical protein